MTAQHAGVVEGHGEVEPRLPAQRRQQRIGPPLLDDPRDEVEGERSDDHRAADIRIGHHRRRVRVHEDRLDARLAQGQACLDAGVVELGRLADEIGPEPMTRTRRGRSVMTARDRGRGRRSATRRSVRRTLGVELDRCDAAASVDEALHRPVVEVTMADAVSGRAERGPSTTSTSWLWAPMSTRPVASSRTAWLPPWCPTASRCVSAPAARARSW